MHPLYRPLGPGSHVLFVTADGLILAALILAGNVQDGSNCNIVSVPTEGNITFVSDVPHISKSEGNPFWLGYDEARDHHSEIWTAFHDGQKYPNPEVDSRQSQSAA